jgi:hypothetical protein
MTAENLDGEQDVSTTRHRNERKGSEPCGAFTLLALPSEGKREQNAMAIEAKLFRANAMSTNGRSISTCRCCKAYAGEFVTLPVATGLHP